MTLPSSGAAFRGALAGLVWFGLVYTVTRWAAPGLPLDPPVALLTTTLLLVIGVAPLEFYASALPLDSWRVQAGLALLAAGAFAANIWLTGQAWPGPASLALLVTAILGGALLAHYALLDRDILLLLSLVYIIADIYSVFFGPTSVIIAQRGPLLNLLTVRFPVVGATRVSPIVGVSDFLVWAVCGAAARRFGFPYAASHLALALGLLASAVLGVGLNRAVPALPLMLAFFLLVNRREFNWRKPSLWLMIGATLLLVVGVGEVAKRLLGRQ